MRFQRDGDTKKKDRGKETNKQTKRETSWGSVMLRGSSFFFFCPPFFFPFCRRTRACACVRLRVLSCADRTFLFFFFAFRVFFFPLARPPPRRANWRAQLRQSSLSPIHNFSTSSFWASLLLYTAISTLDTTVTIKQNLSVTLPLLHPHTYILLQLSGSSSFLNYYSLAYVLRLLFFLFFFFSLRPLSFW